MSDDELIAEMRDLLTQYMSEFPAYRGKPYAKVSEEEKADIAREDRARLVLALRPGFQSAKGAGTE
jgi:hypothetical protein